MHSTKPIVNAASRFIQQCKYLPVEKTQKNGSLAWFAIVCEPILFVTGKPEKMLTWVHLIANWLKYQLLTCLLT